MWARDHVMGRFPFDLLWPSSAHWQLESASLLGYILSSELRKEFVSADWHPPGHPSFAFFRTTPKIAMDLFYQPGGSACKHQPLCFVLFFKFLPFFLPVVTQRLHSWVFPDLLKQRQLRAGRAAGHPGPREEVEEAS